MPGDIANPHPNSLAQVVCDWDPTKLSELAKSFAESSPSPEVSFASFDNYTKYFEPLLLAEVAAELLSSSDKFQRSATTRTPKVRARREEPGSTLAKVIVNKVYSQHTAGFGWSVEIDSFDGRGPVGAVDNDVVACWATSNQQTNTKSSSSANNSNRSSKRGIPDSAILAVVFRCTKRNNCRLIVSKFPDGNEKGIRTDLEEGEEIEETAPNPRLWNVLRLGSLTTLKREFEALRQIKTSVLLPKLMRPHLKGSKGRISTSESPSSNDVISRAMGKEPKDDDVENKFSNEHFFSQVISSNRGLNASQSNAIHHASSCQNGFSIIKGPPGTGKTRTLLTLLNVTHMTQYQRYYEGLLATLSPLQSKPALEKEPVDAGDSRTEGSLLGTMMQQMNKTVSTAIAEKVTQPALRPQRPRLLVCAPSNSAVDEILTRLTKEKFVDGQGREYCPELARIGAGDKVSESAKPFTAEGQAEKFLDNVWAEDMTPEAREKAQTLYLTSWQNRSNSLLVKLAQTPKKEVSSHPVIIDLHEKLERMDRDLRRLKIAVSQGRDALSREEKLRRIARTYVEDAQLVFATLSGSASRILTESCSDEESGQEGTLFDMVFIDEAAQATETSALIPLTLGASRCVLLGDPQQLPATVLSSGAAGLAYGKSLLERMIDGGEVAHMLDVQYRMHPAISSFPRRHFYKGRLVDDEGVQGENRAKPYHRDKVMPRLGPYVFLDISEGEETRSRDDRSIFNRVEAELASLIYTKLKKEYGSDSIFSPAAKLPGSSKGFGVVTPYKRQMQELRQSFDRAGIPTEDVEIDTVDSFQGREKEVIVFSCVRTASTRGIGFVRDVRRMNVGLTRAQSTLIILGSAQALSQGSSDWADLIEDANSRGCLISVSSVHTCLTPAPPIEPPKKVKEASQREIERSQNDFPGSTSSNVAMHRPMKLLRPTSASIPVDPRLRASRRVAQERPTQGAISKNSRPSRPELISNGAAGKGMSDERITESLNSEDIRPVITGGQQNNPGAGLSAAAQERLIGHETDDDAESSLQQTLTLLVNAGFQNVPGIEETLRQHLNGGGVLDIEAVMAAAITSSVNNQERVEQASSSFAHLTNSGQHQLQTSIPPGSEFRATSAKQPSSISEDLVSGSVTPPMQGRNGKEREEPPVVRNVTSNRGKNPGVRKEDGPSKTFDRKRRKDQDVGPSGWDMLFSNKKAKAEVGNEPLHADTNSGSATPKGSQDVDGSHGNIKALSNRPDSKGRQGHENDGHLNTRRMRNEREDNSRMPAKNTHGRDWSTWQDNREQNRKRQRYNDYGDGGGGRQGARGDRQRMRGKRHRGNGGNREMSGRPQDGFHNNNGWGQPGMDPNFDPNYASYQGMAGGMDQRMGHVPHGLNAMPYLHPQAMQQQAMQQQVMQHQAMQQGYHQQAMPHQAYHMQAHPGYHQQDMYQQQAFVQQMPGVSPGMMQNQFHNPEYEVGYNGAMMHGMPRREDWVPGRGGRGGRGHRGGSRGRGRGKYNGRSRRN